MIKILFLAANPPGIAKLDLEKEAKLVEKKLKEGEFGDLFDIRIIWHTCLDDIERELIRYRPTVLHFSGHGHDGQLLTEDGTDGRRLSIRGVARLVELLRGELRLVVLNACSTAPQAQALASSVDCVIGMQAPISDESAIRFAGSLYRALAYNKSIEMSFEQAKAHIEAIGKKETEEPRLYLKSGVDAQRLSLSQNSYRVFVIRDFSSPGVRMFLDGLKDIYDSYENRQLIWNILGLEPQGGEIAELVQRGIREADHIVALLDSPNANVGWEVGLALGFGKSLQFAYLGGELPSWAQIGALKNLVLHHVQDVEGADRLLKRLRWQLASVTPQMNSIKEGHVLLLCPGGPEGSALRIRATRQYPALKTLPADGWGLRDVPTFLAGCRRVIWTIASYPEKADTRDGAANASNAVIAGLACAWSIEVAVLRSSEARVVVDVQPQERIFSKGPEFSRRLEAAIDHPVLPLLRN